MGRIYDFFKHLFSIVNLLIWIVGKSLFTHRYRYKGLVNNKVIVLANGPSLLDSYEYFVNNISNVDFVCLNNMVFTELYSTIKPCYYVLADPVYWLENNYTIDEIVKKTNWDISIFVPSKFYNKSKALTRLNMYIKIYPFNTVVVSSFKKINYFCYKTNLGIPLNTTVLVSAIYLMLNSGYRIIELFGADHTWTKTLSVNDENKVVICDSHYYGTKASPWVKANGLNFTISEILYAFSNMFRGHELLNEYAMYIGAQIFNCTKDSFIDAYPKKILK